MGVGKVVEELEADKEMKEAGALRYGENTSRVERREVDEEERLLAALAYMLGPAAALSFYLLKPEDRFLRFHAIQSVICWLGGILAILVLVLGIVTVSLVPPAAVLFLAVLAYLAYHAERGEWERFPFIGEYAVENC
ncbi:hypothetical protein COV61_02300 [Candidatus Micrarchaeota archaeon CG11_big_fil_rev_8_21_14_0_20_47_5]|nr:MAG: hypothetical protein AUJ17_01225 [Candidatus Micrarchaeota archaeon CG1_02_47_40]PIN83723.1 MAG: hypothetical protein COV61_02300 [Candidatus Micrarchaeota archaeon CG11_big_fil_rev_8_21_14_0_20_47_5]